MNFHDFAHMEKKEELGSDTQQLRAPSICIQVVVASLLYNLMHLLAWEIPIAARHGWRVSLVAGSMVASVSLIAAVLIMTRKAIGLVLAMIPALWAILLQWLLVYVLAGHQEPNGVWWYPVFPVFQGLLIVYFSMLAFRDERDRPTGGDHGTRLTSAIEADERPMTRQRLASPSIYLHAVAGFLSVQIGQKAVRELVVAASYGPRGVSMMLILTLVTVSAAVMIVRRKKWGLGLGIFSGVVLLGQPIVYHVIMQRPCLGGIWWYPIFTACQGAFILYFSALLWRNERTLSEA